MLTEIINIGDELLIGQVTNTNASWMAEQLDFAGFPVHRITVIADDPQQILDALEESVKRSEVVILTGGLGPTKDDLTKDTLCRFFNTRLVFDTVTFQAIEKSFKKRGWYPVSPANRKQAEIPENCIPLHNAFGTAPGMWFEQENEVDGKKHILISMPGVPFEMKAMLTDQVIPRLKTIFRPVTILHHTLLTQGIGESMLSDILEDWEARLPADLHLAYLPQPGIVRLRLTGHGKDHDSLLPEMNKQVASLRKLVQEYYFGEGDATLEAVVGKLLREKGSTVATAESCTGGYIAHLITSIPGSSAYFKGSVIAYSNEIKVNELNVSEAVLNKSGAVSEEVVKEMALTIRKKFSTDYSIATSGIAGPDGGTKDKPVGLTWIAIAGPGGVHAGKYQFGDNRERNIRRAALQALNMLRKYILGRL